MPGLKHSRKSVLSGYGSVLRVITRPPAAPFFERHLSAPPTTLNEAIRRDWEAVASDLKVAVVGVIGSGESSKK